MWDKNSKQLEEIMGSIVILPCNQYSLSETLKDKGKVLSVKFQNLIFLFKI